MSIFNGEKYTWPAGKTMSYETQWCANCGAGHRSMKRFDGEGMLCRGCFQYFARIEQHEAAKHLDQTELCSWECRLHD